MKIALQTAAASVAGLLFFGILLFGPAGTFDFWQAWVFIAVFTVSTGVPNIYLARRKPEVMQRRMHAGPTAENRPTQKIVTSAIFLTVVVLLVVSALDHRFGWSSVPVPVVLMGSVLVGVGLVAAELVVFQNSYAAASITVERGQTLVSTGLYGVVRHPMYTGALIMMIGTPFALGSYWGLVVVLAALLALGFRIDDEEKMLRKELAGYEEYTHKVRYRLVPGVW